MTRDDKHGSPEGKVPSLSECLASADGPEGRRRVIEYLNTRPFPHYEPSAEHPGSLVRIEEDGTRTVGRFVDRRFQAVP